MDVSSSWDAGSLEVPASAVGRMGRHSLFSEGRWEWVLEILAAFNPW